MSDPRGPFRTIATVTSTPEAHLVTFKECDHTGRLTRHFAPPKVGEETHCHACGPYGNNSYRP